MANDKIKNPKSIEPKNLTAQLRYKGVGNPPNSHPASAISNSFPGLEADFRNIWIHIFDGIVLHEASNLVIGVEDKSNKHLLRLLDAPYFLVKAHGKSMVGVVKGPSVTPDVSINDIIPLEWSNALAEIIPMAGKSVICIFENTGGRRKSIQAKLMVRHFFNRDTNAKGQLLNQRVVVDAAMAEPGELTQSLCSPWQNDYRECGCFYWAASRPDYVNVEPGKSGLSAGNNWMEKNRKMSDTKSYISDDADAAQVQKLINYQDLFTDWEKHLRFIIGGRDEAPDTNKKKKPRKK
jgi:hypothetical protein